MQSGCARIDIRYILVCNYRLPKQSIPRLLDISITTNVIIFSSII